jgi:hypothetical protein
MREIPVPTLAFAKLDILNRKASRQREQGQGAEHHERPQTQAAHPPRVGRGALAALRACFKLPTDMRG